MAERHDGGYRQEQEPRERQGQRGRFQGEEEARGSQWRGEEEREYGYRGQGGEGRDWERGERSGWSRGSRGEAFEHSPRGYGSERYGEERYGQQGRPREGYYGGESYGAEGHGYGGYGRESQGRGEFGQRRYGGEQYGGWQGRSRGGPSAREGFGGYEGWNERGLGAWQHGPGEYGERSYGGYGEWPGPEQEGLESGRQGYGGMGAELLEGRRRAGGPEWGLGRAGARGGWRERLRLGSGIEGRFTGRGPKGYRRGDDRIRDDVCDALMADPEIDASSMTVMVSEGEVTLEGSVEDRQTKRDAEDLVEQISGVKQVHNRLRVQPGGAAAEAERGAQAGASVASTASAGAAQQKRSS
ncbi:MAG: BON domain-containing protein [Thermodesulfobacteriota bacterium]